MRKAPKDADEYIAGAPKEVQGKLVELRVAIREAAPTAVESISYGMPYYDYEGKDDWLGSVLQKRKLDSTYALRS